MSDFLNDGFRISSRRTADRHGFWEVAYRDIHHGQLVVGNVQQCTRLSILGYAEHGVQRPYASNAYSSDMVVLPSDGMDEVITIRRPLSPSLEVTKERLVRIRLNSSDRGLLGLATIIGLVLRSSSPQPPANPNLHALTPPHSRLTRPLNHPEPCPFSALSNPHLIIINHPSLISPLTPHLIL